MSTTKYYTITLSAGTTSPGPYTIYLNQFGGTIPLLYPGLSLAQNIERDILLAGVTIETTDTPGTIIVVNEFCDNSITVSTPTTITYKDFCLQITNNRGVSRFFNFIPSTFENGYPSWVDNSDPSVTITYDGTKWILNGYSNGTPIISYDTPTSNPPSNWVEPGVGGITINYNEGSCSATKRSSFEVSINQPTCLCDGSIIFNVNLDNPPYSYSIDNGVTYSSSPIFTNLCSGIYILSVVDILGETFSKTITLDKPEMSTTYTISLNTTNTTPVSNEISLVNSYETTISVNPSLPDGATITFDLIHTNSFYSSPTSGTSVLTTGTILTKNSIDISGSSVFNDNSQSVNTTPGCQSEMIYQSNTNDIWNSLTLTNTDTITLSTTSRVDKTTTGLCVVGYSNDTYSIANAVISGCDCCTLIVNT
jgi:hypothetical protein